MQCNPRAECQKCRYDMSPGNNTQRLAHVDGTDLC